MNKMLPGATVALAAIACVLAAVPAGAQDRDHDGRSDRTEWNRERNHDGRPDQRDRHDKQGAYRWSYYGGRYGYAGYRGHWREGQRYPHWNNSHYYVTDYRAYNLPPPRAGYRYYRDDSGDIVMAAIGSGIIGLILGSQLNHR
jgi:Ni/Co efflux regulator RcnB